MAEPVFMPKLGLYMEDVALVDWFVSEGQCVEVGEALFELETDKTTSEVEAEVEGFCHLLVPRGSRTPIGTVVALIAASQAEYQSLLSNPDLQPPTEFVEAEKGSESVSECGALAAAPLAVRERISLRSTRGLVARRMMESLHGSAQLTSVLELDLVALTTLRSRWPTRSDGRAVGYTAFFVKLLADVLNVHQLLNARIVGGEIELLSDVNIGVAVETREGIVVPVVRDPARLTVDQIDERVRGLAGRARNGEVHPDELEGATFTLSNAGIHPVDITTAILSPPQVALLWLGKVRDRPVAVDGAVVVHPTLQACLTYDHRAVDGGPAAAFLGAFDAALQLAASSMPIPERVL